MKDHHDILVNNIENILAALDDGVYLTDVEGNTLHVNPMYEKLTGLKADELLGRNVHDLIQLGIFDVVVHPEVIKKQKPVTTVQNLKNGKRVVLRGYPVFNDGKIALVITIVRDVTLVGQMRDEIREQRRLVSIYHGQREALQEGSEDGVYTDPRVKHIIELITRVAATDATILLLGESGVGKDRYARMAHRNSARSNEVFLKVDCGSISENLIEAELFGYAPRAFTGASSTGKMGHFEIASKGTIFLDEIGELPLTMQAKLLRVLQDKEVMPVGSSVPRKVDVRIIAATNRNLEKEVKEGNFRADLFYRLRVAVINIPPLRETPVMIPHLVDHFLTRFCNKYNKDVACPEETLEFFLTYSWPGNIRELENLIQSLVVTSERDEILPEELPPNMGVSSADRPSSGTLYSSGRSLKEIMHNLEKRVIQQTIDKQGSVKEAARVLGINRSTLFRKMH